MTSTFAPPSAAALSSSRPCPSTAARSVPPSLATSGSRASSWSATSPAKAVRSEEHTSELQSRLHLVCRLLLEKKKKNKQTLNYIAVLLVAAIVTLSHSTTYT